MEPHTDDLLHQKRDAMYTPLAKALEELHKRRQKFAGRTPGRDWLLHELIGESNPFALLARFIPTPNFETMRFLSLIGETGLTPALCGFTHDKFFPQNPLKRGLARMGFHRGINRRGDPLVDYVTVMDCNQQGRPLRDLQTFWGQSLMAFHHELLTHSMNGHPHPVVFDSSPQYLRSGGDATAYYRRFLFRLCIADGILMEDCLLHGKELAFTRDVVIPSFEAVHSEFGMRPLIVRLTPSEDACALHWFWYPDKLKVIVQERMSVVGADDPKIYRDTNNVVQ